MTILITSIFLSCKLVSELIIIVSNNFLLLKLIINETFSYSVFREKKRYINVVELYLIFYLMHTNKTLKNY